MSICAGVIVAVALKQIDCTPDAKTCAQSDKDLIRNLSREKSADAQILMRNYMMERFLERISLSEYHDKFILKGGMLVAATLPRPDECEVRMM